jgi:hypothetical protein
MQASPLKIIKFKYPTLKSNYFPTLYIPELTRSQNSAALISNHYSQFHFHSILLRRTMVREAWEPSKKVMLLSTQEMKCLSLLPSFLQATPSENSIAVNNNNNNNNNNKAPSWLRRLVAGLPSRHRGPIPDQSMRDLC